MKLGEKPANPDFSVLPYQRPDDCWDYKKYYLYGYKCERRSDAIDLIYVTVNEIGGIDDKKLLKIIPMCFRHGGRMYCSDLRSTVYHYAKMTDKEFQDAWDDYVQDRAKRFLDRRIMQRVFSAFFGIKN